MALIKNSSQWLGSQLFWDVPDVELAEILDLAANIYNANPKIEAAILADQQQDALRKCELRDADRAWEFARKSENTLLDVQATECTDRTLGDGRRRMAPMLVFIFLICRGRWGSITDREAQERMSDSLTLRAFLNAHGISCPKRSTVHENLNVISVETRELVLSAQLCYSFNKGLDDFSRYCLDSTSVEANSCWPTDSGTLRRLLHRAFHYGQQLEKVSLPAFRQWTMPRWLRKVRSIDFQINVTAGKPNSRKEVKLLYKEIVQLAEQLIEKLNLELQNVRCQYKPELFKPSHRNQCEAVLTQIADDCRDAQLMICNIEDRVFNNQNLESWQRISSISDPSAAFICKGDRIPVVGYRPQVVRSGNGLVAHLHTPEGNMGDSGQLVECIDAAIRRTGCAPLEVSVDDGYASEAGKTALEELGIEVVSISGAKGKKLTAADDWESPRFTQARCDRSAVESLMFSLKYTVEFGRVRRRGIEAVRCELLEKAIAYNFSRIVRLQEKSRECLKSAA